MKLTIRRTYYWSALAATVAASSALAQESNTIGPPALSEFELRPGARTPSAESEPLIAPLARPPEATPQRDRAASPPVVSIPAPAAPTLTRPAPARRRTDALPTTTAAPPPDSAVENITPAPGPAIAPAPIETVADPSSADVPTTRPLASAPPSNGPGWWLYALFGVLATGLAALVLRRRNRLAPAAAAPVARAAAAPPSDTPVPARPAPPAIARPWIEIEFVPTQAGANENQAGVQFELLLRNVGESEARDVRVEARLFNAGAAQDKEIGAFFARPDHNGAAAPVPISPQTQIPYRSSVTLPRDEIREVAVQGRRLFIPMVAFNVLYRWGETGAGQTSASYLVGVESTPPAEKMGPFRLDLGPRIYRSIGQRRHRLARTL